MRNKLTGRTIRILEEEGLADAVNEIATVLSGHGLEKHGNRKWMQLEYRSLHDKLQRHMRSPGFDDDSGCLHMAHAGSRLLMIITTMLHTPEYERAAE